MSEKKQVLNFSQRGSEFDKISEVRQSTEQRLNTPSMTSS